MIVYQVINCLYSTKTYVVGTKKTSVNMSDTQQVIVKSYGHHTYLDEG